MGTREEEGTDDVPSFFVSFEEMAAAFNRKHNKESKNYYEFTTVQRFCSFDWS